jgi:3-oxoacyl-[acyl-carrier-protein] synthase II
MVLSEGAGMVVIEELSYARSRGARIYGEITGYGSASSAHHLYQPCPSGNGIRIALEKSLADAGLAPSDIDYINADGVGTVMSDKAESLAIAAAFGPHAQKVPVSSTKSMTGHLGTAAGAAELIFSALALQEGILPPTINYTTPDPDCPLDCVPNQAREQKITTALSINQGLGGQCTCLIIKRVD